MGAFRLPFSEGSSEGREFTPACLILHDAAVNPSELNLEISTSKTWQQHPVLTTAALRTVFIGDFARWARDLPTEGGDHGNSARSSDLTATPKVFHFSRVQPHLIAAESPPEDAHLKDHTRCVLKQKGEKDKKNKPKQMNNYPLFKNTM